MIVATERYASSANLSNPNDGLIFSPTLFSTGEKVHSITTSTDICLDESGGVFFLKPITTYQNNEPAQLVYLDSVGIPVPRPIWVNYSSNFMATPYSGETLSRVLGALDDEKALMLIGKVGELVKRVHQVMAVIPPASDIVSRAYDPTAHIVDNFYYKHSGGLSQSDYRDYKNSGNGFYLTDNVIKPALSGSEVKKLFIPNSINGGTALNRLIGTINELAGSYLERLKPFSKTIVTSDGLTKTVLDIPDPEYFEGDFKPDNILVAGEDKNPEIVIIDPVISKGVALFDLAKFTSRFLLGGHARKSTDLLLCFFEGYKDMPNMTKPEYGPFSFVDLVHIDMLNALKMYVKKYSDGERQYYLVDSLGSEDFCENVEYLIGQERLN